MTAKDPHDETPADHRRRTEAKLTAWPLIHIGHHKSGSTWLQQNLFPNAAARFIWPWTIWDIVDRIIQPHELEFDADEVRHFFEPGMTRAAKLGLVPVVSTEGLAGNPQTGGYNSKQNADRLIAMFPHGRVLLIIREQRAMMRSAYRQYIRMGGAACARDYFALPKKEPRVPRFRLGHFAYDRLIEYYHRLYGKGRVCVLPLEMLAGDPSGFVSRIVQFAGAVDPGPLPYEHHVNPSLSGTAAAIQRQVNRVFGRSSFNPGAPFDSLRFRRAIPHVARYLPKVLSKVIDRRLDQFIERMVGDHFAESNHRTARLTGLPLDQYGYEM